MRPACPTMRSRCCMARRDRRRRVGGRCRARRRVLHRLDRGGATSTGAGARTAHRAADRRDRRHQRHDRRQHRLPEQVVDAVVKAPSAPPASAARRCACCCCMRRGRGRDRDAARGAVAELAVGDPAQLATDVGPVIDAEAYAGLRRRSSASAPRARLIGATPVSSTFERLVRRWPSRLSAMAELEAGDLRPGAARAALARRGRRWSPRSTRSATA